MILVFAPFFSTHFLHGIEVVKDAREIISEILEYFGVKAPTLAASLNLNYSRIQDIQLGRVKKISLKLANVICEAYPEINKAYLLKGEGSLVNNAGDNINVPHLSHAIAGNDIKDDSISNGDLFEAVRHLQHLNEQYLKKNEELMIVNGKLRQILNDVIAVMIEELPPHKLKAIYAKINSELQNLQK